MKAKKKPATKESMREIAKRFNVSPNTISLQAKAGLDVHDDEALLNYLIGSRPAYVVPAGLKVKSIGKATAVSATPQEEGLRAAIDRLRKSEVASHKKYLNAKGADSTRLLKEWQIILEQLRKVEESQPDIEAANSNSISKEELAKVLGDFFKTLRQDLDALPNQISVIGQGADKETLNKIVEERVLRIIDNLHKGRGLYEDIKE
jgi:hypothetical protein